MRLPFSIALAVIMIGGALRPASSVADPPADAPIGFEAPELVLDGSQYVKRSDPNSSQFGPLYPTFADIDGDGKTDLMVGVEDRHSDDGGRLFVYVNRGTNARPVYAKPTSLDESVASARIPSG